MSKITIEFDFFEDKAEYLAAIAGISLAGVLFEMNNYFRNKLKHGELSDEAHSELEKAWEYMRDEIAQLSVNFEDIT